MRVFRFGVAAMVTVAFGAFQVSPAHATLTAQEFKCSATLAKSFSKLQASVLKIKSKCHNADISGKTDSPDNCATLDEKATAKITKAKEKLQKKVSKDCASVCSPSNDIRCATDRACPAAHVASPANNAIAENCDGEGGQNPFDLASLQFPGPYCEWVLGHPMLSVTDLGDCVNALVETTADAVDEQIYAQLDESPPVDPDAAKCVSGISKAVTKALGSAYLAAADCRDTRFSANIATAPVFACAAQDADVIAAVDAATDSLAEAIDKSCDNTQIGQLSGLCAAQGSSPTTVADAQVCLGDMVREVATSERGYNRHVYSPISMINVTHPNSAKGYCGDKVVDPTREEHTGIGEECDGSDTPCGAGHCLPPGDIFECTCDNVPRERFVVNGAESATDSDAGWMGSSHDATHNDGFGYVNALSDCTCDSFSGATCTSPSGDDICNIAGNMAPRCNDDIDGTQTCDERGDGDGTPENSDCNRCDDYSLNAGTWCANGANPNETLCQSQCIVDSTGLPTVPATPCTNQSGCAEGQTCRGRCDSTIACNKMTEGSPLPLISASNPVCIMLEYKTDISGTKNMVTGETEVHYTTRSLISLGSVFAQPCPVCAGTCVGGSANGSSCYGRCAIDDAPCLFDSDCASMGDVCTESSVECPGAGGFCSLDLRCSEGPNAGRLCRPDATTVLGEVSHDCPPVPNAAISGTGVTQPFGTITTKEVEFQAGGACTDPAYANFTCPCPADTPPNTGVPSKPNACSGACDAGPNEGQPCASGTGQYTTCVGGGDGGLACDEDSDCDSNNCSGTSNFCTAGTTSLLGIACNANADCGGGGLCEPPCPGGRCVPLCKQEGRCNGGGRDGDPCSMLEHCKQCTAGSATLLGTACDHHSRCDSTVGSGDGICAPAPGVTCDITDPEEGVCAAGPNKFRCTGAGFTTIPCTLEYGTCNTGHCLIGSPDKYGQACTVGSDCLDTPNVPVSAGCETGVDALPGTADDIPGAGECEPRPEDCYYDNGRATGGDTVIGGGDATNVNINACFCTPANANPAVNLASGFGGPSRIRRQGVAFVNVPSIP